MKYESLALKFHDERIMILVLPLFVSGPRSRKQNPTVLIFKRGTHWSSWEI